MLNLKKNYEEIKNKLIDQELFKHYLGKNFDNDCTNIEDIQNIEELKFQNEQDNQNISNNDEINNETGKKNTSLIVITPFYIIFYIFLKTIIFK